MPLALLTGLGFDFGFETGFSGIFTWGLGFGFGLGSGSGSGLLKVATVTGVLQVVLLILRERPQACSENRGFQLLWRQAPYLSRW